MSFLLALLLLPAAASDLPRNPIEQSMVVGAEEQQGLDALLSGQNVLARLKTLRERYSADGDLAGYTRDREPVVAELHASWARLLQSREDIKQTQTTQQMFNVISLAGAARKQALTGKKADPNIPGPRVVEMGRIMDLTRQLGEAQGQVYFAIKEEEAFLAAEQERARHRKRLMALAAAAFLILAAGGALFVCRLRKKL
ncbi:MAG TPA: hypothetical protein DCM05_11075 [Elusimicrobia bacterium]|nr:hypothetical protein [Elusimicrobiota bacterium]